ncbi:MAG: hypothetical protein K8S62_09495 [Candidatus Sabulitectum sp.]|nr:hypothetical protein [Candidatus Sabulitectum sp.]
MKWSIIAVIILSILLAAGCGGEAGNRTAEQTEELNDPEVLGNTVADVYETMYDELNHVVNLGLSVEDLSAEIAAMKEDYIGQFVELGAVREEMNEEQKEIANSTIRSRFYNLDMEIYESVNDQISAYRVQDNDLANEIAEFNILAQYADYELLREQSPDEAARLGI